MNQVYGLALRESVRSSSGQSARPVFGRSWVRILSGTQIFSLSHARDMLNILFSHLFHRAKKFTLFHSFIKNVLLVLVNKVIFSLDHARKPPLDTCDWSCIDSWHVVIGLVWKFVGAIQKHWLLQQALPSLFALFSSPPPPPLFAPATLAILFSVALLFASILSCFLLPCLLQDKQFLHKLQNVNIRKAHGPDNITSREMKMVYSGFSHCIANISRMSLRETTYPRKWKVGKVGKREVCANYRPLTLQSIPSKISQSVIC